MTHAVRAGGRLAERPGFGPALHGELRARLVQPLMVFSAGEEDERHPIPTIPGQYLLSLTEAVREARAAARAGIAGVLLFAAPDRRDETALIAAERDWLVPRAIRAVKDALPELGVATDVCVCAYTTHGQCVLFRDGVPDVPGTLARLGEIAVAHAEAGADLLVPSGMLEGSVGAIRDALRSAGRAWVAVAGAVKFASTLYAPYRAAVGIPAGGDRAVPLIEPEDAAAARAVARRAAAEGADVLVLKPGLAALDVVALLRAETALPVAAFHVAGEHVLLRAADETGAVEGRALLLEAARASRRAGADLVISYGALETAELLEESRLT